MSGMPGANGNFSAVIPITNGSKNRLDLHARFAIDSLSFPAVTWPGTQDQIFYEEF
jgi:hypothetical protein